MQAGVRYTLAAGGRSTYTGTKQVYVSLHASVSYEKQGGGTDTYNFFFYKNGALLIGSQTQVVGGTGTCLLYTSPSPRDKRQSRMPSSA